MSIKITDDNILSSNKDIFGDWIHNTNKLNKQFKNAKPFPHIIINNFLKPEIIEDIHNKYPKLDSNWWKYWNPIEVKYALDDLQKMPKIIQNVFYALSSDKFIDIIKRITDIDNLEYDEYLHGAGLHIHPRYGRLNMHLDYEIHPITYKQRRLNIILYLNKEWNAEWNGDTELWDAEMNNCIVSNPVVFNSAMIFQTNEISWHGVPKKILCPNDIYRKTIAYYYVSPIINKQYNTKIGSNNGFRNKAAFVRYPLSIPDKRLDRLLSIRPYRHITQEDLDTLWPEWNEKDS